MDCLLTGNCPLSLTQEVVYLVSFALTVGPHEQVAANSVVLLWTSGSHEQVILRGPQIPPCTSVSEKEVPGESGALVLAARSHQQVPLDRVRLLLTLGLHQTVLLGEGPPLELRETHEVPSGVVPLLPWRRE